MKVYLLALLTLIATLLQTPTIMASSNNCDNLMKKILNPILEENVIIGPEFLDLNKELRDYIRLYYNQKFEHYDVILLRTILEGFYDLNLEVKLNKEAYDLEIWTYSLMDAFPYTKDFFKDSPILKLKISMHHDFDEAMPEMFRTYSSQTNTITLDIKSFFMLLSGVPTASLQREIAYAKMYTYEDKLLLNYQMALKQNNQINLDKAIRALDSYPYHLVFNDMDKLISTPLLNPKMTIYSSQDIYTQGSFIAWDLQQFLHLKVGDDASQLNLTVFDHQIYLKKLDELQNFLGIENQNMLNVLEKYRDKMQLFSPSSFSAITPQNAVIYSIRGHDVPSFYAMKYYNEIQQGLLQHPENLQAFEHKAKNIIFDQLASYTEQTKKKLNLFPQAIEKLEILQKELLVELSQNNNILLQKGLDLLLEYERVARELSLNLSPFPK